MGVRPPAYDATPHLARLAGIPTLVVSAAEDRLAPPRLGQDLAARMEGSRYVEFPGAAHGLTVQMPEGVNPLLLDHFARAEGAREGASTVSAAG